VEVTGCYRSVAMAIIVGACDANFYSSSINLHVFVTIDRVNNNLSGEYADFEIRTLGDFNVRPEIVVGSVRHRNVSGRTVDVEGSGGMLSIVGGGKLAVDTNFAMVRTSYRVATGWKLKLDATAGREWALLIAASGGTIGKGWKGQEKNQEHYRRPTDHRTLP